MILRAIKYLGFVITFTLVVSAIAYAAIIAYYGISPTWVPYGIFMNYIGIAAEFFLFPTIVAAIFRKNKIVFVLVFSIILYFILKGAHIAP